MENTHYLFPAASFLLFLIIAVGVLQGWFIGVNVGAHGNIANIQNSGVHSFFSGITHLFDTVIFSILSLALFVYLAVKKRKEAFVFSILSLVGGAIIGRVLKSAFASERPMGYLIQETGYSFPSGHVLKATLFMLVLLFVFKDKIKNIKWKNTFVIFCWVIIVLIAFSRLYLGIHWLSDIIAAFVVGVAWVSLVQLLLNSKKI